MSDSALQKLVSVFKTQQHDYKVSTELFGQFDSSQLRRIEIRVRRKNSSTTD
jgi:hypothetical protein